MKKKSIRFIALLMSLILAFGVPMSAFANDEDDIYNDYSKDAMNTPTGDGIVWGNSAYNGIDVNNVEIRDNPLPTTSTTYPSVFPKDLLDLPRLSDQEIQKIIDAVLPVMTFEEKVRILGLSDTDPDTRSGVGWLLGVPRLGIPEIRFHDGPAGVSTNARNYRETSNVPNANVQASTWDPKYAYNIGQVYGMEHSSIGLGYQLGTQYDLIRMPIWARAKDAFGEDYYLAATMAGAQTSGVQENGGLAMAKHIGAYSTDGDTLLWLEVDEQTLHQAYLYPFEYAAKNSQLSSIMSTYNRLNGFYTSSNYYLQVETLRNMWQWKGAMVPDWGSNREFSMMLGTDISQDGYNNLRNSILKAIGYGNLTWRRVDNAVEHALYSLGVGGFLNLVEIDKDTGLAKEDTDRTRIQFADTYDIDRAEGLLEQTNAFGLEVAEKGIVLLKNDDGVLPVEQGTVALVGMGAEKLYGGTGGERSFGVLEYMLNPKEVFTSNLGADRVTSAITVSPYGVVVPDTAFFQDAEGTAPGLKRSDDTIDEKIEFLYEKGQFSGGDAFTTNHTWTGYIEIPADIHSFVAQSNGGTMNYSIQAKTTAGADYTISGNRGGGVEWDNYTPDGLNFSANNVSTRNIAPGIYPITVTQTVDSNDSYREQAIRLSWITKSQQDADREAARTAAAENDTTIMFVQSGRTGHSPIPVTDYNMLKLPDGSYSNASGNTDYVSIIKELAGISHENGNKFVLVVFSPSAFAFDGDWLGDVDALISAYYPGQSYATALYNIITGKVNPSGKTAVTYPKTIYDTVLTYDDDVKNERVGVQGQNSERTAKYTEGLEFGYRWYDSAEAQAAGAEYQYPFGYGLSYTTFDYANIKTAFDDEANELTVSFDVTNTGDRLGTEIAQVYIGPADLPSDKDYVQQAVKQLVGYKRIEDIEPGETVKTSITVEERMLSYWDSGIDDDALLQAQDGSYGKWVFATGEREIMVGTSSADLYLNETVEMIPQATASIAASSVLDINDTKELVYQIDISNATGANMFEIEAAFDSSKLSFVDYKIELPASLSPTALGGVDYSVNNGKFTATIGLMGKDKVIASPAQTPLLTIKFLVKDGVDYGDAITGTLISVYTHTPLSAKSVKLSAVLDPAFVVTDIFSPNRYDVDGDGQITLSDVSFLINKYYLSAKGDANWDTAGRFDTNADGFIDLSDIMYIISLI